MITPTFAAGRCNLFGDPLAALPTTSTNGITGTWAPALNNTATTTYTFTPAAGQCATTATLTITVNPTGNTNIYCSCCNLFRTIHWLHCQQLLPMVSPVHGLLHSIILQQLLIHLPNCRTVCDNNNINYHS